MRPAPKLPPLGRSIRVLLVGLGAHGGGASVVRYLAKHGCIVRVTDAKNARELAPTLRSLRRVRFQRRFGGYRIADVRWASIVVQNPAVPREHPVLQAARRLGRPIINDVVLFLAAAPGPVLAVTGTRGKTTTTSLVASMLGAPRGGLSGEPMLDVLPALHPGQSAAIEVSSWQCERVAPNRAAPDVVVLTNVSRDHLNRYPSYSAYREAKASLLRWQTPRDSAAVLNRDDRFVRSLGSRVRGKRWWFSLAPFPDENGAFLRNGWLTVRVDGVDQRIVHRSALRMHGEHSVANALAAIAAATAVGVPRKRIAAAVRAFRGVPGRQELVAVRRGVSYINDTTATSPAGTLAAIHAFRSMRPTLIVGGVDKNLHFAELARTIDRYVRTLVLLPGDASDRLALCLKRATVHRVASMPEAVRTAAAIARSGSAVILSPGAASFNLFRHEFHRGDQFVRAVRRLP